MNSMFLLAGWLFFSACNHQPQTPLTFLKEERPPKQNIQAVSIADTNSWNYFLQHLPQKAGTIIDYGGKIVPDQSKAFSIVTYDVGNRDLQQCADALIRLRAEYLFKQNRSEEISFSFTSGDVYSFTDYCSGKLPVPRGNKVAFVFGAAKPKTYSSLRRYLDIVYTYAGTISLASELKPATDFAIGTIVITPGSPGHCFMVTDEAVTTNGQKLYKLVEGYTPAQSIYILNNINDPQLGCWHTLKKGSPIVTASYRFENYKLRRFE